jgi:molybdopterin-guanine dinucleotide biosynthesis protein A
MNSMPGLSRKGFVLAGGLSTRMGPDKALLNLGGHSLLERALAVLQAVCPEVGVVGDPEKFSGYADAVVDVYPGCGPLGGIHAALRSSPADLNLMLAVDMPFVSEELLAFLLATAAGCDAVVTVPRTGRGFQPLCAVYRREFADAAEAALKAGKFKVDAVFASVTVRIVEEAELSAAGLSEESFTNLNTPEDLRWANAAFQ